MHVRSFFECPSARAQPGAERRSSDFHVALIGKTHHHLVEPDVLAVLDHGVDEGFVCLKARGASCRLTRFRLAFCGAVDPADRRRSSDTKSFGASTGREPALRSFQNAITQILAQCTAHPNHHPWLESLKQNRHVMSPQQQFNPRRICSNILPSEPYQGSDRRPGHGKSRRPSDLGSVSSSSRARTKSLFNNHCRAFAGTQVTVCLKRDVSAIPRGGTARSGCAPPMNGLHRRG